MEIKFNSFLKTWVEHKKNGNKMRKNGNNKKEWTRDEEEEEMRKKKQWIYYGYGIAKPLREPRARHSIEIFTDSCK